MILLEEPKGPEGKEGGVKERVDSRRGKRMDGEVDQE